MSSSAGRRKGAGIAACWGVLLVCGLLLAACGGEEPRLSMPSGPTGSQPLAQAQTTATSGVPVAPTPIGNVNSGGSIGPEIQSAPTLPPAPTAAVTQPPATPPPAQASQPPAPPQPTPVPGGGSSTQNQPVPTPVLDVRWRMVYVGIDNKLWTVSRAGNDPQLLLGMPAGSDPAGRVINLNLSPDATRLLYTVVAGSPAVQRHYLLNLTSGILSKQKYNGLWAQDNRHILPTGGQVIVFDTWTGGEVNLGAGTNANWTADGHIIAVRQGNIWMVPYPASSGQAQQLTTYPASGDGAWTFFGPLQYQFTNRILFAGAPTNTLGARQNAIRLESLNIGTKTVTELAPGTGTDLRFLALSPSGNQLAAAMQAAVGSCASAGTVLVVRADGSAAPIKINIPAGDAKFYYLRGLTWSPDQWVVYSGLEQNCSGSTITTVGVEHIFIVNPAAPDSPTVMLDGTFPVWIAPRGLGMLGPGAVAAR